MDFEVRNLSQKWFSETIPLNYKENAIAVIGSGENGTVTITSDDMTTTDVIAITVAAEANSALSVTYADGEISIVLGTDAEGNADDTKNTTKLIATEISKIEGFTAIESGTGATAIDTATTEDVEFTNGQFGTPCPQAGICFINGSTYYVATKADNSVYNTGWRTFTLADY